jgi:hypothetical protein
LVIETSSKTLESVVNKTSLKSRSKISCHYSKQLASSGVQRRGFIMEKVRVLPLLSLVVKKITKKWREGIEFSP